MTIHNVELPGMPEPTEAELLAVEYDNAQRELARLSNERHELDNAIARQKSIVDRLRMRVVRS